MKALPSLKRDPSPLQASCSAYARLCVLLSQQNKSLRGLLGPGARALPATARPAIRHARAVQPSTSTTPSSNSAPRPLPPLYSTSLKAMFRRALSSRSLRWSVLAAAAAASSGVAVAETSTHANEDHLRGLPSSQFLLLELRWNPKRPSPLAVPTEPGSQHRAHSPTCSPLPPQLSL